jgi:hypothetical protein
MNWITILGICSRGPKDGLSGKPGLSHVAPSSRSGACTFPFVWTAASLLVMRWLVEWLIGAGSLQALSISLLSRLVLHVTCQDYTVVVRVIHFRCSHQARGRITQPDLPEMAQCALSPLSDKHV